MCKCVEGTSKNMKNNGVTSATCIMDLAGGFQNDKKCQCGNEAPVG